MESEALLVMAPGFGLPTSSLRPLAEAVQARVPDVRLWVGVAAIDYISLARDLMAPGMSQADLGEAIVASGKMGGVVEGVVEAAKQQGFCAQETSWGRITNMYMLCHSAAGLLLWDVMFRSAAGGVMLASVFNNEYVQHTHVNTEDWGRPLMILGGELDGQMRWPWEATHMYTSACLAEKVGTSFAATHKPFILVPGANHTQTAHAPPAAAPGSSAQASTQKAPGGRSSSDSRSNGGGGADRATGSAAGGERGDIPATISDEEAVAALGQAIGCFLTAHCCQDPKPRAESARKLAAMSQQTASRAAPWFKLSGMGDIAAAWGGTPAGGRDAAPSAEACGTPLLRGAHRSAGGGRLSPALHPGVVSAAEGFAASAQRRLLASLPAAAAARVKVVATVHTDTQAFIFSQPLLEPQPDGTLVLLVHCHLHWRSLDAPPDADGGANVGEADTHDSSSGRQPVQPLGDSGSAGDNRSAAVVAASSGDGGGCKDPGPGGEARARKSTAGHGAALQAAAPEYWLKLKRPQAVAEALGLAGAFPDGLTPEELQQTTLDAALAAAPEAAAHRYQKSGRRILISGTGPWPGMDAASFFRDSRMRFRGEDPYATSDAAAASRGSTVRRQGDGGAVQLEGGGGFVWVSAPLMTTPSAGELGAASGAGASRAAAAGGGGGGGGSGKSIEAGGAGPSSEGASSGSRAPAEVVAGAGGDAVYMGRFLGAWYTKAMSEAMALEWVMLDCMRPGDPAW